MSILTLVVSTTDVSIQYVTSPGHQITMITRMICIATQGIAPPEVKSRDIYLGSIPWIVLQLILVALMIVFPEMVTYWLDKPVVIDPAALQQQFDAIPQFGTIDLQGLTPPKP